MPLPPWMNQRNPYQDYKPPQLNISEMPVEAKNITINLDKGFFEIAKAIFEQQKELIQTIAKIKYDASAEGKLEEEEAKAEAAGEEGEESAEAAGEAEDSGEERRADSDRRKGAPDMRGDGAPDRRSGKDRRDEAEAAAEEEAAGAGDEGAPGKEPAAEKREDNAPPPPLAADGQTAAAEEEPPADGVMEPPKIPRCRPTARRWRVPKATRAAKAKKKRRRTRSRKSAVFSTQDPRPGRHPVSHAHIRLH